MKQVEITTNLITEFCNHSGQSLSIEKSVAFTVPGTMRETKNRIKNIMGIAFTENLGKYLGIPLLNDRAS